MLLMMQVYLHPIFVNLNNCHGPTAWLCFCFLCIAFPPSSLPHLHTVCQWAWQQQSDTPESDQLVTHRFYLPGLSTTLLLNYYVPHGDFWALLIVFFFFCICPYTLVFVGSCRNLQLCFALLPAHLLSVPPRLHSTLPCLRDCLPANQDFSSAVPSGEHCLYCWASYHMAQTKEKT